MKTKKINLLVWAFLMLGFFTSTTVSAQENTSGTKKITIITKTTDENGVTTTRTVEKEGDETEDIDWNEVMRYELDGDDVEIEIEQAPEAPETLFRFKMPHREYAITRGENLEDDHAFLGVYTNTESDGALEITGLVEKSGAEQAGLRTDDIITRIGDSQVSSYDDLVQALGKHKPGETVTVEYRRGDKTETVQAQLTKRSDYFNKEVRWSGSDGEGGSFNWGDLEHKLDMKGTCEDLGNLFKEEKPKLGVNIEDAENNTGVKINSVTENSAAAESGLLSGDIIYQVDDKKIATVNDLIEAVQSHKPGDAVTVHYLRNGQQGQSTATLKSGGTFFKFDSDAEGFPRNMAFFHNNESPAKRQIIIRKSVDADDLPATESESTPLNAGDQEFTLYPNPSNGVFQVEYKSGDIAPITVIVTDVNGKEVYKQEVKDFSGFYKNEILMDNQPDGSYILNIQQGDKIVTEKLLLQK